MKQLAQESTPAVWMSEEEEGGGCVEGEERVDIPAKMSKPSSVLPENGTG